METTYNCESCNFTTTSKHLFRRHNDSEMHLEKIKNESSKPKFVCEKCAKIYNYKPGLLRHMQTCNNTTPEPRNEIVRDQTQGNSVHVMEERNKIVELENQIVQLKSYINEHTTQLKIHQDKIKSLRDDHEKLINVFLIYSLKDLPTTST